MVLWNAPGVWRLAALRRQVRQSRASPVRGVLDEDVGRAPKACLQLFENGEISIPTSNAGPKKELSSLRHRSRSISVGARLTTEPNGRAMGRGGDLKDAS
jgi:hypothetical protein